MVSHVLLPPGFFEMFDVPVFSDVKFATDDGLNVLIICLFNKLKHPKHIAMIGNGYC